MPNVPLSATLAVTRRLGDAREADDVLRIVADAVHDTLGMPTVVNRRRVECDEFEVTLLRGGGPATQALMGERYREEMILRLVDERYARDGVYIIPSDAPAWDGFEGVVVIEQQEAVAAPGAWLPGDTLAIPLLDRAGEVLAVIVADEPADGLIPSAERLELVAIVAQAAATALERCLLEATALEAEREGAELAFLSASLAAGLHEREILQRAAEGVCAACGFELAVIGLFDREGGISLTAGAGPHSDALIGHTLEAHELAAMMRPEHRRGDSYLVAGQAVEDACEQVLYRSHRNATGRRGWNHHSLLVPLATGGGATIGVLIVDEPRDHLLPSPDKLRRIELFARQTALLLEGARNLAAAREQATRDPLTDLENARAFEAALAEALADARPIALVTLDIDHFKSVNDRRGHLRGDALLLDLAGALRHGVPATARTFRIGGDEFAILFDEADPQRVVTMLEEVRRAANVAGVGFSAGVALAPAHAAGPEALRHAADQALYASKRAGRGRVTVFEPRAGGPSSSAVLTRALERVAWRPGGSSELLVNLLDGLTSALDADRGLYFEHDAASDTVLPRHVRGRVARSPQERATYVLREWPECRRMLRTGQPIICAAGDPACDPSEAAYLRALGFGSMVMIPVPVDGVAAGFIELCFVASEAVGHAQLEHAIAVADIAGLALTQERRRAELEQAYLDTVGALSSALEAKDADTGDHARALAGLAGRVARRLGLPEEEARLVEYAAAFHDIGKIATPTEILRKRGPLTASERAEVERHVVNGARIVSEIGFLRPIVPAVRHSHERWDGGGYPDGLEGEAIPLAARIVFACDAWHAMTTDRPYRRALPPPRAAAELAASAGSQFDPAVVRALLAELGDAAGGAAAA